MIERFIEFITSGGLSIIDVIDVLIVAVIIYNIISLFKGTRAIQITSGFIVIFAIFLLSGGFGFRTLNWLLRYLFASAGLIAIILFQPEIRNFLANLARNPLLRIFSKRESEEEMLDDLVYAITTMADKKIGGIIVLEKNVGLRNYIEAGIRIDALLSFDLLLTIFNPSSPIHDGAVIVRGERIIAASCFLPLTLNPRLSREMGTRHRAAIGISEETDAIVIVVSEERGEISIAHKSSITRPLNVKNLTKITTNLQQDVEDSSDLMKRYKRQFTKTRIQVSNEE